MSRQERNKKNASALDTPYGPARRVQRTPGCLREISPQSLVVKGVFLAEWDGPRTRRVAVKVMAG